MADLTGDLNISVEGQPRTQGYSANAADTFYKGALVFIDTGGGVQCTWGAGDIAVGISPKQQVIAASGDNVEVITEGFVWTPLFASAAVTDEGDYVVNDATDSDNIADMKALSTITAGANDVMIAKCMKYTATRVRLYFGPGVTGRLYDATLHWI